MYLMVSIDTEEAFKWDAPFARDHHSTSYFSQFHHKIMDYLINQEIIPILCVSYPLLENASITSTLHQWFSTQKAIPASHLHSWVNPPFEEKVNSFNSYQCNLPYTLEKQKMVQLHQKFQDSLGLSPIFFKAGRYGIGPNTNKILKDLGYQYDLSILAGKECLKDGGIDHRHLQSFIFTGKENIIHVPVSGEYSGFLGQFNAAQKLYYSFNFLRPYLSRLSICQYNMLTPESMPLKEMIDMTYQSLKQGKEFFHLTFHSTIADTNSIPYIQTEQESDLIINRIKEYIDFFKSLKGQSLECHNFENTLKKYNNKIKTNILY